MIIKMNFFEDIMKCYAFQGVDKSLAKKFTARCFDVDYFSDMEGDNPENRNTESDGNARQCLADMKSTDAFYVKIPMAKQDEWTKEWFEKQMKEISSQSFGYIVSTDWEADVRCGIEENDISYMVEEFQVEDIVQTLAYIGGRNAVLLIGREPKDKEENFSGLFMQRGNWIVVDEQGAFQWAEREDGIYLKYTCDDEGELFSIFECKKRM